MPPTLLHLRGLFSDPVVSDPVVGNGGRAVLGRGGPVLLLSMRRIADLVAYCILYEFEDVITEATGADRVDVVDVAALERSRRAYKLMRLTSGSRRLARRLAPEPSTVRLERDYELFFPIFNNPHELYALRTIPNWRDRCRVAACFVSEVWPHLLPEYLLELLAQFDHVFLGTRSCVDEVGRIVGRPCTYLPLAVDVVRFSPLPNPPTRNIDLCNIGRRSPITHEALIALANARKISYYFDTIRGGSGKDRKQRTFHVDRPEDHRLLLANVLQRSRYFIANRSRINEPEYTGNREEISGRFYEGAAAGAVMIGQAPNTPAFQSQFSWPDAVIPVPFDSPDIGRILAELDADPHRLARIRRNHVCNAALQHDWVHRLGTVFNVLGIHPTEGMSQRERLLHGLAELTSQSELP